MKPDGRPLRRITASRARRLVGFLGLAALVILCSGPAVGDELPPQDPANPSLMQGYLSTTGRSNALPAKQWMRVPPTAAYVRIGGRRDGQTGARAEVYVMSPKGAKHDYGMLPRTRVRTVALGLAPALVTLEMTQLRKKYIEPWVLVGGDVFQRGAENELKGRLNVWVVDLEIDGNKVRLGGNCRTAFPASIVLEGDSQYSSGYGGQLAGTLDIPRFTGCGTGNDRLLTSFVSGPDNPIEITQTAICLDDSCPPAPKPPPEYPLPNN